MIEPELTRTGAAVNISAMGRYRRGGQAMPFGLMRGMPALMLGSMLLGGCISVEAPDKPIVIELNINIRSEVVYRLANDAGNTIEENADIF